MSAAVVQGDANAYGGTGEGTTTVVWETAPTTGNLLLAIITTYNDFGPTPETEIKSSKNESSSSERKP